MKSLWFCIVVRYVFIYYMRAWCILDTSILTDVIFASFFWAFGLSLNFIECLIKAEVLDVDNYNLSIFYFIVYAAVSM